MYPTCIDVPYEVYLSLYTCSSLACLWYSVSTDITFSFHPRFVYLLHPMHLHFHFCFSSVHFQRWNHLVRFFYGWNSFWNFKQVFLIVGKVHQWPKTEERESERERESWGCAGKSVFCLPLTTVFCLRHLSDWLGQTPTPALWNTARNAAWLVVVHGPRPHWSMAALFVSLAGVSLSAHRLHGMGHGRLMWPLLCQSNVSLCQCLCVCVSVGSWLFVIVRSGTVEASCVDRCGSFCVEV